jgi:hypothetical protein
LKTTTIITTAILSLAGISPASAICFNDCTPYAYQQQYDMQRQAAERQRQQDAWAQQQWQRENSAWGKQRGLSNGLGYSND